MKRYDTKVSDETIRVQTDEEWIEVGDVGTVVELLGSPTYTITYDHPERYDWLDTDEDGRMTFDVVETIDSYTFDADFVNELASTPMERRNDGVPKRTALFADLLADIWDSKGNVADF